MDKDRTFLDVVLYTGNEESFDLHSLTAAVGLAVQVEETSGAAPWTDVKAHVDGNHLALIWQGLGLTIPIRPAPIKQLQTSAVRTQSGN